MSDEVLFTNAAAGEGEDDPTPQKTRRVFDGTRWIYVPEENANQWDDRVWHAEVPRDDPH
ncbi:hypothetical protein [Williamsia sp.]|uniref:hypothetical protein n=1 Tax=Williamsia sp. TaxID=1872085 RepID=UPI002F939434